MQNRGVGSPGGRGQRWSLFPLRTPWLTLLPWAHHTRLGPQELGLLPVGSAHPFPLYTLSPWLCWLIQNVKWCLNTVSPKLRVFSSVLSGWLCDSVTGFSDCGPSWAQYPPLSPASLALPYDCTNEPTACKPHPPRSARLFPALWTPTRLGAMRRCLPKRKRSSWKGKQVHEAQGSEAGRPQTRPGAEREPRPAGGPLLHGPAGRLQLKISKVFMQMKKWLSSR